MSTKTAITNLLNLSELNLPKLRNKHARYGI
jgi:hypothetical protein